MANPMPINDLRAQLLQGQVIPAHPLALTTERKLDERRQRALSRYYVAAQAGGLAVGVHTTQFAIRDHGLYAPVLALASETIDAALQNQPRAFLQKMPRPFVKIAGVCGQTAQATNEAETARSLGYDAALLSLGAFAQADDQTVLTHCRAVADVVPVVGFYLQPAVGGRVFSYRFWREFFEIPNVVAVKIAPFNRYQTIDVVRACINAGRNDVALYTGNDDTIVTDLLTPWEFDGVPRTIVGGLLGHWAVWTRGAVSLLDEIKAARTAWDKRPYSQLLQWLTQAAQITDANAALFDAAHGFAGCIAGIHEILRRQGLMENILCLDLHETLSPGQSAELDRVCRSYPEMMRADNDLIARHLDDWLG